MLTILYFLLSLSILVFVHELGHFIFAKKFNVYCHEFSLFMGPKIYAKKIGETTYCLRSIPMGGYVSMAGEQDAQSKEYFGVEVPTERTINGINKWKKAIILAAGAIFNIIFSFLLLIIFFVGNGVVNEDSFVRVAPNSLFAQAGLQNGDKIVAMTSRIEGGSSPFTITIDAYEDITTIIYETVPTSIDENNLPVQVLDITYERKGVLQPMVSISRTITKVETQTSGSEIIVTKVEPLFGVTADNRKVGLGESLQLAVKTEYTMSTLVFDALGKLLTTKEGIENVAGPIGMVAAANQYAAGGFFSFLFFVALIGVNLGIFNLLPFPALDGGRLLMVAIEGITRKKVNPKIEGIINGIGFMLLIGLLIVVTIKDILFIT